MRGDAECRFAGYALKQATGVGTPAVRSIAAAYMSQGAWSPSPDQFVFIGNGRTKHRRRAPCGVHIISG
jgi:hypothetical protein